MCSREECFECESEYDYELEREIENETRALAREDDEYRAYLCGTVRNGDEIFLCYSQPGEGMHCPLCARCGR